MAFKYDKEKRILSALLKLKTSTIKNHLRGNKHQKLSSEKTINDRIESEQDDEPLLDKLECDDNFYF